MLFCAKNVLEVNIVVHYHYYDFDWTRPPSETTSMMSCVYLLSSSVLAVSRAGPNVMRDRFVQ